ncbi:MAG: DNA-protecting protein DprA [Deltaproteobacteria bacterium]|nr:DNA-protecting protein DprA [Deltaproteobacteria bacterium]MBW1942016.1 DNA-protecting protein DprA [Deltaproteobacteria bacterium]MBW2206315.1 DNA-protecting protein DprA [Deltaproteobacteria bacterium]
MGSTWSDSRCWWVALHLIPGLGNIAGKKLLERFGTPKGIFDAKRSELISVEGVRKGVAGKIANQEWESDPEKVLEIVIKNGARPIPYGDPAYPALLTEIHDPPFLLYVKGQDIPSGLTMVGVVGSRNPTPYGSKAARELAQGLARRGAGVVSGMARGIDAAAHWGCLEGLGFTVAVMGTGIDIIYPASNKKLFERIAQKGAIVSEFPPGTPPEPKNFPIRNRIISGMARGVLVVEATKKSGSLITASSALNQGRDVFAVPGSINSFKSTGCHFLIKQGAALVENADDIMDQLGLNYPHVPKKDRFKDEPPGPTEELEKRIYDLISDYPLQIDHIARLGKLDPAQVSSVLTKMELKGMIRQLPGKMFVR